jgi:hypothetical protein
MEVDEKSAQAEFDEFEQRQTELVERFIVAVERLTMGGTDAPTGFEALSMALGGEHLKDSVAQALRDGSSEIAHALNNVADAIREKGSQ